MKIVDFLNCKIDVSKRVFIPRIETEFWIKKAITELKIEHPFHGYPKLKILDLFAGSGCIGIAILKNIKNSQVDFVDIDKRTIEQTKINLKLNKILKTRYRIYKSNTELPKEAKVKMRTLFSSPLFEKLKNRKYDYIFANPPYVAKERIKEVDEEVLRTEPWISFFAGRGGLFHIKKFLKEAKNHLKKKGVIYLEFDSKQKEEIEKILKIMGLGARAQLGRAVGGLESDFQFKKDQFKKYRWLRIKYVKN